MQIIPERLKRRMTPRVLCCSGLVVLLLEQAGFGRGLPQFQLRVVDERHGTIHVPVVDLNGDGRLDFVALISQEHEVIEAFLNRGDGTFEREQIFAAGDPSYSSSGIELADLDADGDLDLVVGSFSYEAVSKPQLVQYQ